MSGNPPTCGCQAPRLVLTGVVVLSFIVFLVWTTSRRTRPSASPPPQEAAGSNRAPSHERMAGQSATNRLSLQRVLHYGSGEGELGMVHEKELPPVGPEAFAVAKDGSILVADVVNQRVAVYSSDGTYLRSIALPGIALGDVAADAQGRVYVYDQVRHALLQYDAQGAPQSALDINPADLGARGYFHVAGDSVYFADAAARDVLVATLQDGALTPADTSVERNAEGIHGDSGRIYSMSLDKGQTLRVQVRDPASESATQSLEVPMPGIVSARYAGEDQAQRFYVQTERLAGTQIVLNVLSFGPRASSWRRRRCRRMITPSGPPGSWTCGGMGRSCSSCPSASRPS